MNNKIKPTTSLWKVGDWVEVRSKEEIFQTLDHSGQLDGMPFMPEMLAFCGKRFQIYKRAHKTCDTIFPVRGRRVASAVHLDTRCDGAAHGGCQADCMLFWKDAWLKPVSDAGKGSSAVRSAAYPAHARPTVAACTESDLWTNTTAPSLPNAPVTYVCQATRLPYASADLNWWEVDQYLEDYRSGNVGLWRILCGLMYFLFLNISNAGIGLGRPMRWFYDTFYRLWGGAPFPRRNGTIPEDQPTPTLILDIQPGELVRIKSHEEILKTLNTRNRNRGLYFDAEEVPYCGGTYKVLKRVTKLINERTGALQEMKNPCLILDSVICQSRYSECRLFCPRSIYAYWREIWLERVGPPPAAQQPAQETTVAVDCLPDSSSK